MHWYRIKITAGDTAVLSNCNTAYVIANNKQQSHGEYYHAHTRRIQPNEKARVKRSGQHHSRRQAAIQLRREKPHGDIKSG